MFENLQTSADIEDSQDKLGGGGVLDSGIYEFTIDQAYVTKADSGAMALNLKLSNEAGNRIQQQLWMTSGKAKGCLNYYTDKAGKKQYLPGFDLANALCLLTVGKEINQLVPEEKILNIYDFTAKRELPTKVNVVVELFNKSIIAGISKELVDKNKDTGTVDASGKKIYAATGESREQNNIEKFFRARDGMTVGEIKGGATTGEFKNAWLERNANKVKDKTTKGVVSSPAGGANSKPARSLFED
jgi:hypothetical protein